MAARFGPYTPTQPSEPSATSLSGVADTSGIASALAGSLGNATAWAVNVSRYAPLFEDLVLAGPRIVKKLGSYMAITEPVAGPAARYITDATNIEAEHVTQGIMESLAPNGGLEALAGDQTSAAASSSRLTVDSARGIGSVFGYATSRWALSCVAMVVILNRTYIFAATRRRLRLRWPTRLLLRFLPLVLLVIQARGLLQSIQCQTSPDFAMLRWGNMSKSSDMMFSQTSGLLHSLSSTLLFSPTDEQSCHAVRMIPSGETVSSRDLMGSLSLLWPLFGTSCLSQFLETVSCAVQGRPVAPETGMTLFEQSLAFAEADAAISNQLGWGILSKSQPVNAPTSALGGTIALTRSMIMKRVNTSPEVLLVAFLSTMTHITSHALGILDLQARYRLISTGFWGLCFMGSIVWSAYTFDLDDPSTQGLLRFPTVSIVGFVPHVLVLTGIATCMCIYGIALFLSALAPPTSHETRSLSFRQRIQQAHGNMQANISLSEIRITREMDFYTALLRMGFGAITMASEAVYLNEDRHVSVKRRTWLEEERFREAEELQRKFIGGGLSDSRYDQIGVVGLIPVKGGPAIAPNGYARERAAQKLPKSRGERNPRVGIGASERSSRWLLALEFLLSINKLLGRVAARALLWVFRVLRIRYRPRWLLQVARHPKILNAQSKPSANGQGTSRASAAAAPSTSRDGMQTMDVLDVEAEFRRVSNGQDEASLDSDLYQYWLKGGWWGSRDTSGEFEPSSDDDFDTTSVISMSTAGGETDMGSCWESDSDGDFDDGQKTPTQRSPHVRREASPFVDSPIQVSDLARLLHPQSAEERQEAARLSAHLQDSGIMTRSRFKQMEKMERTRVLTTTPSKTSLHRTGNSMVTPSRNTTGRSAKLSPEEEEAQLERLLLSRRQDGVAHNGQSTAWEDGGSGFGTDGPQCVVCQSSPRTIIVWPCRCLSLCDDCRVSLAMNNFDKCVCCRREVISFSRIFVP